MEPTITDAQKMQMVLEEIGISSYRLTQELDLSASAIYHVLSGKNKFSINMIDKICQAYPHLNKKFLVKSIGELVPEKQNSSSDSEYVLVKKLELDQVKLDIQKIYSILLNLNEK